MTKHKRDKNLLFCKITRKIMPRKKSSFLKHVQGKKFNREIKLFFYTQRKKSRKSWRKMRYFADLAVQEKDQHRQKIMLTKYLKLQKEFEDVCSYVKS